MKIGVALPLGQLTSRSPGQHRGDDGDQVGTAFADLLAALAAMQGNEARKIDLPELLGQAPQGVESTRAPDLAPQIGTHGKAFEQGRLLVETALPFQNRELPAPGIRATEVLDLRVTAPFPSNAPLAHRPAQDSSGAFANILSQWLQRAAGHVSGGKAASRASQPVLHWPQAQPQAANMPASPTGLARILPSYTAAERAQSAEPSLTSHTGAGTAPFGAHLIAIEGGLRLLLRLPKLAEGELAELRADLARLFESFGHHTHDIIIHEIARGQG